MSLALSSIPTSRLPVVNVASVPQRSPLRYPGGKTWLVPHIREWLLHKRPKTLIEPFAGGGIVSLTAIMENLADRAAMIEIDRDVAAFWHTAFECGPALKERIERFKPTYSALRKLESKPPDTLVDHAFRTLALNRTRRGGILAPGASYSRTGENGRGILSRWYPETLAARLDAIQEYADRIAFLEGDGLKALPLFLGGPAKRTAVFLDPPYTAHGGKKAGSRLYAHSKFDHPRLFELMASSNCNFMMTYDAAPEIIELVKQHGFAAARLSMKNTHHRRIPEIVITREPLFA